MFWFALASLFPALLLFAASVWGGVWAVAAVLSITVLVFFMDKLVSQVMPAGGDGLWLSFALGAVHFLVLFLGVWAVGRGAHLDGFEKAGLLIGLSLYLGQVSNSNAHELIHRPGRAARRLGVGIYGSLLFGHHASAHRLVHHVHAATPNDPNTARFGEGFWHYLIRAWPAGFIAGKRAEDRLRAQRAPPGWTHPYVGYAALSCGSVGASFALAGMPGLAAVLAIAISAQVQLYLSDYVQHYGLARAIASDGKYAPIGPEHSWNAPHWYSSAMMLNAPRHSDHHVHPGRAYPDLRFEPHAMPVLPHSLPVMAVLAIVPSIWRHVMDRRVSAFRDGEGFSSCSGRSILRADPVPM